ncbi:hypothetical protein GP486_007699 [Trichoglossum hirsutum]|uniref:SAM-dependent methyltransferase TRM5/TYW2-type domain-containing protein n=1 Tax=Trichoglossum hirsutum TaxID=265104 RepID=A0A9P8L6P6_9PEZI|nr:hypothetical protein GP486_007699 [Trichoglossum hirsutum]
MSLFRPPINRAMRVLDRSFFTKEVPLSAARIFDNRLITKFRTDLSRDLLKLERISSVRVDPDPNNAEAGRKCLLLRPEVKVDDDIMTSILPEEDQDEIPVGFTLVGHIAHLNLRAPYLPYKHLLATILLDKNPSVRTVINKTSDVGTTSSFRTFTYELLAGSPDLNVEMREADCTFRFDYSKVYWNSRLNTEHGRLVTMFKPGEAVCDVMAGVGPFSVPAGKKGVFVWANDLNPDSYESLRDAVARNKVRRPPLLCLRFGQEILTKPPTRRSRSSFALSTRTPQPSYPTR